jgi:WD40-like Beta Propeller Repeat
MKRIDIDGGSVQDLARAIVPAGGAWNRDGVILFQLVPDGELFRTSATGGEPVPMTQLGPQGTGHRAPQFLPDGRHLLYYVMGNQQTRGIYLGEIGGTGSRRLLDADTPAVYASSGHLLFVQQGTLYAQSIDPVRLELLGNPHPVAEHVTFGGVTAIAALSASAAGPIAYRTGPSVGKRQMVWFDRSGKEIAKIGDPESFGPAYPSISYDDRFLAEQRTISGNTDIWLLDLFRGVATRFTSDPQPDIAPIWSPHGDRIVYSSLGKEGFDLYQKSVTGTASEKLLETPQSKQATDWSSDRRFLLYRSLDPKSDWDIWALPFDGDRKPFPVVRTNFEERDGQFSPDGKWIAYQSNESGRFEIYVQPFPGPGVRSLVSTNGGAQVRWRHDGKELFYIALDGRLMAVPFKLASNGQAVESGAPVPLFTAGVGAVQDIAPPHYVVSSDGQRFLVDTVVEEAASPITVLLNWKPQSK